MTQPRRSSVDALRALPEVFDLSTATRLLDMERGIAKTYLSRWGKAGLVRPAGQRAGIYFNLIRAPDAPERRAVDALRMAYPSAVLRGLGVLHAAGWTTQIPRRTTVAVVARRTLMSLDGFEVCGRPRSWYEAVHADVRTRKDFSTYDLPSLSPAMALADCYADPRSWRPDPDDLDDLGDDAWRDVRSAFAALGVPEPAWLADMQAPAPTPR